MQFAVWCSTKKLFHIHQKLNNFLQHIIKIHTTMSASVRYFNNRLNDYSGAAVQISKELFKSRCLDYAGHIFRHQTFSADDCDGGLYVGVAGVAYMSYYLSQHSEFIENRVEFLNKSEEYMKCALSYVEQPRIKADKSMQAAFLLGASGTYAVAAVIAKALGKEAEYNSHLQSYAGLADVCLPVNFLRCGSDELLVGRAGYLSGILFLRKALKHQVIPEEKLFALCQAVVKSGTDYSKKHNSPCPLMFAYYGTEYLGAAHGLSGILQMLLSFPNYLDANSEAEKKVKGSVDFLLSLQTPSGNFPCAMDEVKRPRAESDELVHWCHGAPGVVYLMAKAFLRWKEDKYLQSCLSCGEIVWQKGLLKKGPGICHGVAGNGYVFLLLYRLTNDKKHLHRAVQFGSFLFENEFKKARVPDRPLSLYEGLSGTACFLADLITLETAHFPFFDVF